LRRVIGKGGAAYVALADDLVRKHAVPVKNPSARNRNGRWRDPFSSGDRNPQPSGSSQYSALLDYGVGDSQTFFFTMPFVEGETLQAKIRREGQPPLRDTLLVAEGVATALDHAHGHALIHRDIKPANILLSEGRTIVADFGIARAMTVERSRQITGSGVSFGTPEYMSPEQAGGTRELDARGDVYALGCTVYE
jgi:serine/threonine protein kinase